MTYISLRLFYNMEIITNLENKGILRRVFNMYHSCIVEVKYLKYRSVIEISPTDEDVTVLRIMNKYLTLIKEEYDEFRTEDVDPVHLEYLGDKINGFTTFFSHVVDDEVEEFSERQLDNQLAYIVEIKNELLNEI